MTSISPWVRGPSKNYIKTGRDCRRRKLWWARRYTGSYLLFHQDLSPSRQAKSETTTRCIRMQSGGYRVRRAAWIICTHLISIRVRHVGTILIWEKDSWMTTTWWSPRKWSSQSPPLKSSKKCSPSSITSSRTPMINKKSVQGIIRSPWFKRG